MSPLSSTTTTASNGRLVAGVKLAVAPPLVRLKAPETGAPSVVTRNDAAVTVAAATGSLNVMLMGAVVPIPTAPFAGLALTTTGAVESGDTVRNVDTNAARALAARSRTVESTVRV